MTVDSSADSNNIAFESVHGFHGDFKFILVENASDTMISFPVNSTFGIDLIRRL